MSIGVGEILSDTFAMVRERLWRLVGLYLVWFAILIGFSLLAMIVMGGSVAALGMGMQNPDALAGLGAGFFAMMALVYLGYILVTSAQTAAMCTMASPLRTGDFGDAMAAGVRSALPMLGVMIVLLVAYVVIFSLVGAIGSALGEIGTLVSLVAAFVLMLWLGARVGIVMAVVPVDGVRNPFRAIGRAWSLTAGHALPILIAFVVFILVGGAAFAALLLPVFAAGLDEPSPGVMVLVFLGLVVIGLAFLISYYALLSAIHGKLAGGTAAAAAFE